MSEPRMIAYKDGATGWLVFSNPERLNAVSYEMWQAIPDLMADFVADPDIRVVVLRGEGDKAFVSGADISQFEKKRGTKDAIAEYDQATYRANAAILSCPKPTVAMIQGYCVGGGLGIALCCDLRFSADNSRFAIPAGRLGLGYKYDGVKRLVDVVGPSYAREIFYTARQFNVDEALAMGLINRSFEVAELPKAIAELCERIGNNAPLTLRAVKLAVEAALSDSAARDRAVVNAAVDACFASEDYKEGRRAFVEKRPPRFRGV
jgi:enoyl-CoA hydratase/carnithine racemase